MTEEQKISVRDYLISKKLPLELLIEIEDHFITQIHEYLKEDLSFEKAFDKTKDIWKDELTLSWDGSCDLEDKCELLRNYRKSKRNTLIKQTLKYSAITISIVYVIFFLLPFPIKRWYILTTYLLFALAPIVLFIYNWKSYKLLRKSKIPISYYQIGVLGTGMCSYNIFQMSQHIIDSEKIVDFVSHPWKSIFILVVLSVIYILSTGSIICHKELLKTIKSLNHHLA